MSIVSGAEICLEKKSVDIGLINVYNGGAEGQSRTDTGLPPPVFEFDAMPEHKWASALIRCKIEAITCR